MRYIAMAIVLMLFACSAKAKDWSGTPNPWYEKQMLTPETLKAYKLGWESCCNHGDVCQECVVHHVSNKPPFNEGWYYTKDGVTRELPPHIIEFVQWTPTGKPVLFIAPFAAGAIVQGTPVCLKVPGGGT